MMAPLWPKDFERILWKDRNAKISITKTNDENWSLYEKQRNHWLTLLRKTKKPDFQKLNIKEIGKTKTFWKTVRPNFSCKD